MTLINLADLANRMEECADDMVRAAPLQLGTSLARSYSLALGRMADNIRAAWEDAKAQAQELNYGVHQEASDAK